MWLDEHRVILRPSTRREVVVLLVTDARGTVTRRRYELAPVSTPAAPSRAAPKACVLTPLDVVRAPSLGEPACAFRWGGSTDATSASVEVLQGTGCVLYVPGLQRIAL